MISPWNSLRSLSESIPSATKILQPRDRYVMSTGQFSHSSPSFTSNSAHLFNAKAILDKSVALLATFHACGPILIYLDQQGFRNIRSIFSGTKSPALAYRQTLPWKINCWTAGVWAVIGWGGVHGSVQEGDKLDRCGQRIDRGRQEVWSGWKYASI